jgi:hypothetical protein
MFWIVAAPIGLSILSLPLIFLVGLIAVPDNDLSDFGDSMSSPTAVQRQQ